MKHVCGLSVVKFSRDRVRKNRRRGKGSKGKERKRKEQLDKEIVGEICHEIIKNDEIGMQVSRMESYLV